MSKRDRERRAQEDAALEADHRKLRARLLVMTEGITNYAADLLVEVQRQNESKRKEEST